MEMGCTGEKPGKGRERFVPSAFAIINRFRSFSQG
ncbi:hypothetical protein BACCAP_00234 [Pseudoflavonifractor capillosus ATCC 29799]|uniref:Uncharacterized protein n=1 Tax=Pseudoflavonifractor capillosus ATCC 29799 TaxID=411467 RepID=A6NPW7_9FIRM|nr:hypothetical protein BACCAP_00234 [Pseudoflavonifractor capillosus ATCC 29799]